MNRLLLALFAAWASALPVPEGCGDLGCDVAEAVALLQQDSALRLRKRAHGGLQPASRGGEPSPDLPEPSAVWTLFPGDAPGPARSPPPGPEALTEPDPNQDVYQKCTPGDKGMYYQNVSVPQLYAFLVDPGSANFKDAAVLIFPGGGFDFLAWEKEGVDIAKWLNGLGYSAYVLKYRVPLASVLPGQSALAVIDAQRAVSLIRSKASESGLNDKRLGILGFSAGAGLCGMVTGASTRAYDAIDDVDKSSFAVDFALYLYGAGMPTQARRAPPTFIATAADDPCAPARAVSMFHDALVFNNRHAEMHVYDGGKHGYGRCTMYTWTGDWMPACQWIADAEAWLQTTVMGVKRPLPE
eukprot:CAMPEP_0195080966 /NCGR_PEP_ID=MMETSP0448-20130528/22549_1 /TAXON_ID=66468 /ORGANISM="Heterocapsa triquestra, Strain CCMP 448" /LENGTH=354 /DNA_ID=CAMNT_0040113963 /DNA_START=1 /DNA_END=1065 /DNA_ORIENTATION=+